jgi:GNAT superfamily N-acetyltransferase
MRPSVTIREATGRDAGTIVRLVRELAAFEGRSAEVRITEADVLRDGVSGRACFECLLAEVDGTALGFVLFLHNYSTFQGRPGIFVEDLYVAERARRHGVGRRLLARLAQIAIERGCPRLDLGVLDWNPARGFYDRLGFRHRTGWLPYRLAGDALAQLAADAN